MDEFEMRTDQLDAGDVVRCIAARPGVVVVEVAGDAFLFHDPDADHPDDRMLPFATVVTGDRHDRASDLDREGAFRLNLGLTRATYRSLFGPPPTRRDEHGVLDTGFDHTVAGRLMPHPVYASQYWVCLVDPGRAVFEATLPLVAEAHELAARKYAGRRARRAGGAG